MAANENCTIALMGGDDPGISPLQIFVRAKEEINDIFVKIEDYVHDTVTYMQSVQQDGSIVKSDDAVQVEGYIAKVRAIQNVLTQNHMKVAFFGRTSNGKSSVINAMLHEKILPTGFGHTTDCFLQVEGSDSGESYLVIEGSTEKQNVESVQQLANALCKEKLGESQLVHIYWPKDKCLLLRNDVFFLDSPGTDMTSNLNEWIDRYCLDADIFVLVANAESTLTLAEKNFFHKVLTLVSKPNIFMLNNKWDVVASEPDFVDQVRLQHMERAVEFLVKELNVCTQKEANQRIFFVSAKEALQARLREQKGLPAHSGALADGFQNRYFEFQAFEQKFEECISKSAVKTKFEHHSERGKLIVSEIRQIMDSTYEQAQQLKMQKAVAKKEIHDKLNFTEQQLLLLRQEMKDKIRRMVEDVEQMVSEALSEEIRRLSVLVDDFLLPFSPEERGLNAYKETLYLHVENGLVSKLRARLATKFAMNIATIQEEMKERMSGLLPAEKKQVLLNTLPRREPFKILFRLNCDNLFSDFHEDLDFRFSWGPDGSNSKNPSLQGDDNTAETVRTVGVLGTLSAGTAAATWIAAAAPAVTAGAVVGSVYFGKYLYERLRWTNEAKERAFKQQYVAHATWKLRLIVDETSADCSHQVQRELSSTLAQLGRLVVEATNDMDAEIKTLDKEIKQLEEAANSAKVLRNKANYITKQLEIFDDAFLKLHN